MNVSELQPHQQRVVSEVQTLNQQLEKLSTFIASPLFASVAEEEQERLLRQRELQTQLSRVLHARIDYFMRCAAENKC